uniref:PH domain-containing protein n=1 Tax=candidate division WOR-3 bacterium TaxID=2052148 RepID=A0A7C3YQV7_UNCW3
MTYRIHKAKENPKKTLFVSLFLFFLFLFFLLFYGLFWTILAFLLLFFALNSYFLPITYTLTEDEIIVDKGLYKFKRNWQEFKKVIETRNGLILSPFAHRTFLDNFRGLHIFLPGEKEEIVKFIRGRLTQNTNQG